MNQSFDADFYFKKANCKSFISYFYIIVQTELFYKYVAYNLMFSRRLCLRAGTDAPGPRHPAGLNCTPTWSEHGVFGTYLRMERVLSCSSGNQISGI